jgi:hypothetical protein
MIENSSGLSGYSGYSNIRIPMKFIHLEGGIGDCLMFRNIIPELLEKYKNVVIGSHYNQIFVGMGVDLVLYEQIKEVANENVYNWCIEHKWTGHLIDAFRKMYGL